MLATGELETLAVLPWTAQMDDSSGILGGMPGMEPAGNARTNERVQARVCSDDLRLLSEQEIEALLPPPLRHHMRFGRAYTRLLEVARCLPAAHIHVMMQAIARTKLSASRHPSASLDTVIDLLIVAMANCCDESFLTGFFYELLGPFDALATRQKESFLSALEGVIELAAA